MLLTVDIEEKGLSKRLVVLNPYINNTLTCDIIGQPEVLYRWNHSQCNKDIPVTFQKLLLPDKCVRVGDIQTILCSAYVAGKHDIHVYAWLSAEFSEKAAKN